MKQLKISPQLALPEDFATEGVLVTGMRGSGKTSTAIHFAELLYDAGIPFVIVDPKGDTYGIRSSADGKSPGLSVPVFGGLHGDFPLDKTLGARIADLLVEEVLSAVLDVSQLTKTGELPVFLTAFCNQLMHRHQMEPHVRTVILAEAHRYIPQKVTNEVAKLKEAAAAILLEGRSFGLGCWAETQRPARLNKDVVEEVGNAVLPRIGVAATNDKKTIAGWVAHYELSSEIVDSLTSLKAGEAWVLSPEMDIVRRVQMDRRRTFDSGATPKAGQARRTPSTMADIDAGAIKEALAESIEKAKADDPRELRKQIADLQKKLREVPPPPAPVTVEVEVPVMPPEATSRLEELMVELDSSLQAAREAWERWKRDRQDVPRARPAGGGARPRDVGQGKPAQRPDPPARRQPSRSPVPRAEGAEGLTEPQRRVLDAVAWLNAVGFPQPSKLQVGFIARYRVGKKVGGTYGNVLGALRTAGLLDYPSQGAVALTAEGEATATPADIEMSTEGLQAAVFARLGETERRVLQVLVDAYPEPLSKQEVGASAGYAVGAKVGGTFGNILGRLRSLGLIDYPSAGQAVATDVLFLDA